MLMSIPPSLSPGWMTLTSSKLRPDLRERAERLAIECAKRAALVALPGLRVYVPAPPGVDCSGPDDDRARERSRLLLLSEAESCVIPESSKPGIDGSDGISRAAACASIRRHTRDGVSSMCAIVRAAEQEEEAWKDGSAEAGGRQGV
jgi:hypothetical protein